MMINRDRRDHRISTNGAPSAKKSVPIDTRTDIDRRSGKDRRCDYDEQRKLIRSKLKKSVFVFLKKPRRFKLSKPQVIKFGMILDISLGGLRAQYVGSEMYPYNHETLSILTDDGIAVIEDIPFKIITDYKFTRLPDNTWLRRCGIKFENLSDKHKLHLNQLIQNYS